jgi:hypothetical protein
VDNDAAAVDRIDADLRWVGAATAAVARHPSLWWTALHQIVVLAAPGWWRRWPPLPLPDPEYMRFRLVTMYGDVGHHPDPGDVIHYLEWCKSVRGVAR